MGLLSQSLTGQKTTVCEGHHGKPGLTKEWIQAHVVGVAIWPAGKSTKNQLKYPWERRGTISKPCLQIWTFCCPFCLPPSQLWGRGECQRGSRSCLPHPRHVAGAFFNRYYLRKKDYLPLKVVREIWLLHQCGHSDYEMETVFLDIMSLGLKVSRKILGPTGAFIQGQGTLFSLKGVLQLKKFYFLRQM